ncbi:MAG: hypothetical protein K2J08_11890 [Ruminococcus sp.]|nr:hypothetical protein [Ruminococcus sp.]
MGEFIIWLLLIAMAYMVIRSLRPKKKPPEPEEEPTKKEIPKKDYPQDFMNKIAVEAIKGKSAEDIIKDNPELTEDEINEWKNILVDNISKIEEENKELAFKVGKLVLQVEWLEKVCKKSIGDDWKDKTGYKFL